jgi:CheY-like chemotaxis protein
MGQNINVLIVEQEEEQAQVIKQTLEEKSSGNKSTCTLCMAVSCNEALDWLEYNTRTYKRPDLIILDIHCEEGSDNISGREIIRHVKNHILLKHIPIVVLCSDQNKDDIDFAYRERANCFILKPSDPEELKSLVQDIWEFWSECTTLYIPK